jgi:hypothetical protein
VTSNAEQRSARLADARHRVGAQKHLDVLQALSEMALEGVPITQSSVATRAQVHRNFIGQHPELRAAIAAISATAPAPPTLTRGHVSEASLKTDLVTARDRIAKLSRQIAVLEKRLSAAGSPHRPEPEEPRTSALTLRISELETALIARDRQIRDLTADLEAATQVNRDFVRQLNRPPFLTS